MNKYLIEIYPEKYWGVAKVFKNGIEIAEISRFFDVTSDFIIIYETEGGTGTGFYKGQIEKKIFIGDSEFEKKYVRKK